MGSNELKKDALTKSDRILIGIMALMGSVIAYNLWADKAMDAGFEFIQSIFNY